MECKLSNAKNDPLYLQLLASDTNFAFRYHFPPGPNITAKYIVAENTTFHIAKSEHDYQLLQPYDNPVPKYQTFYQPRNNRTKTPIGTGDWSTGSGLPALFFTKIGSQPFYVHIKESGFDGRYPISHIANYTSDVGFGLGFPDPEDGDGKMGMVWPHSPLPWSTPWRIITIGSSAAPIIEDTSVTDLAAPSKVSVSNFVRPGTSSWSWFSNTKNAQNYTATQEFMQLSTRQGWPYTLLDAQ
jgi:alpha-glucosidase